MVSPHVFEVTAERFATDVVQQSMQVPILLDFWADWCGPCRTLTPVLEQAADAYGGAFKLGTVDTEREQDLAYAFQVRSIPLVVLMSGGKPIDAFTGALPLREVQAFLGRHGIAPAGAAQAPEAEPDSPEARLAAAKQALLAGHLADARAALQAIPEGSDVHAERQRIEEGLSLFDAVLDPSQPAAAALLRAREALQRGELREAMDHVLGSVEIDRGFQGELGRKAMLLAMALAGEDSDESEDYRRRLATLLY